MKNRSSAQAHYLEVTKRELCVNQKSRSNNLKDNKKLVIFSFLLFLLISQLCFTLSVYANYGLKSTLVNPESEEETRFGVSIGVTNEYFFVGADLANIGEIVEAGKVFVFDHEGEFIKSLESEEPQDHDWYGTEIICDKGLVFIRKNQGGINYWGSFSAVDWPGQVFVYDGSGSYQFMLEPSEFEPYGTYGLNVAALQDSILVGYPNVDTEQGQRTGKVLEYDIDGNYITSHNSPEPQVEGYFGYNIIADDEVIVVLQFAGPGIYYAMDGSVFIFDLEWNLIKRLDDPLEFKNEFGKSMALHEDYIYVGDDFAHVDDKAAAGCIYVYDKQGELVRTIFSPEPKGVENFAEIIVIQNDLLYVGARQNDDEMIDAGKVYVMDLEGELIEELVSPEPSYKGFFGYSLAVFGDKVYVGELGSDKVYIFEEGFSSTTQETQTSTETTETSETSTSTGIPGYPVLSITVAILLFVMFRVYYLHESNFPSLIQES